MDNPEHPLHQTVILHYDYILYSLLDGPLQEIFLAHSYQYLQNNST